MAGGTGYLTRRAAGTALVGGALAFGALRLFGSVAPVSYSDRLAGALADMPLRTASSRLDLINFTEELRDGRVSMRSVVRLTWPPGMRQRSFRAEAADPDQAFEMLTARIAGYFSALS